jgi:hypothetical protein
VAVVALVAAAGEVRAEEDVMDAVLTTSSGVEANLSARWGRPVVLFYEDRHSVTLNDETKKALFAAGKERGLLERVGIVAVANLQELNWQPALFFALEAVKGEEKKAGVPIYLDLTGALSRPPWSLSPKTSSVLVLDATGREVFRVSGRLSAAQRAGLFDAVERLLASGGPSSPSP